MYSIQVYVCECFHCVGDILDFIFVWKQSMTAKSTFVYSVVLWSFAQFHNTRIHVKFSICACNIQSLMMNTLNWNNFNEMNYESLNTITAMILIDMETERLSEKNGLWNIFSNVNFEFLSKKKSFTDAIWIYWSCFAKFVI